MKKDFTQDFVPDPESTAYLIVRSGSKYMLLHSTHEHEEDFYSTPSFKFSHGTSLTLAVVKHIDTYSLSIESLRTLILEERLSYSFADDTPGATSQVMVVLANVGVADNITIKTGEDRLFLDKEDFKGKLLASPYCNRWLSDAMSLLS